MPSHSTNTVGITTKAGGGKKRTSMEHITQNLTYKIKKKEKRTKAADSYNNVLQLQWSIPFCTPNMYVPCMHTQCFRWRERGNAVQSMKVLVKPFLEGHCTNSTGKRNKLLQNELCTAWALSPSLCAKHASADQQPSSDLQKGGEKVSQLAILNPDKSVCMQHFAFCWCACI